MSGPPFISRSQILAQRPAQTSASNPLGPGLSLKFVCQSWLCGSPCLGRAFRFPECRDLDFSCLFSHSPARPGKNPARSVTAATVETGLLSDPLWYYWSSPVIQIKSTFLFHFQTYCSDVTWLMQQKKCPFGKVFLEGKEIGWTPPHNPERKLHKKMFFTHLFPPNPHII